MVLSLGDQPGLVASVRSLVRQDPRPELVVVNSGGGDPAATLARAGLAQVPVVNVPERLFAGGARNRGIAATRARYVAFLAADSIAEPGWVAARLAHHAAGADAVSCVMTAPPEASLGSRAAHLLLNHRRTPDTPPQARLLYGLSYDRALFSRFGRFREDMRAGEDSDFNQRIRDSVSIAWAPDVGTWHPGPDTALDLIRDQYARGRRRVVAERGLGRAHSAGTIARSAKLNVRLAVRQARRTSDRDERARLMRSLPLVVPGSLAYMAGSLTTVAAAELRNAVHPQLRGAVRRLAGPRA